MFRFPGAVARHVYESSAEHEPCLPDAHCRGVRFSFGTLPMRPRQFTCLLTGAAALLFVVHVQFRPEFTQPKIVKPKPEPNRYQHAHPKAPAFKEPPAPTLAVPSASADGRLGALGRLAGRLGTHPARASPHPQGAAMAPAGPRCVTSRARLTAPFGQLTSLMMTRSWRRTINRRGQWRM